MDKKLAIALAVGAALGAGVVAAVSVNDASAVAIDKIITVKGSSAVTTTICLWKAQDGSLSAQVRAKALTDDGGVGEEGTEDVVVPPDQAAVISNWMDGKALALWRTARGLEK